jgi:CTP synthase (UTP-ammonia lyase)
MSPRLALVGDRSPSVRAHTRVPSILDALHDRYGIAVDAYWIPTDKAFDLDGFDGIWMLPGSPYRSETGAVNAARTARERRIPFLGTCGGFQHALLEFARDVCGISAGHAENAPDVGDPLIAPLACTLAGHQGKVRLTPGSLISTITGETSAVVHYNCSFGLNPAHTGRLEQHGMRFTAHDEEGAVRAAELPDHPFYLATLFQPELAEEVPHPIIRAFAETLTGKI